MRSETEYAMPTKDSATSGTATRLASWLTIGVRCGCTREQPMTAGPVAGLLNSREKSNLQKEKLAVADFAKNW